LFPTYPGKDNDGLNKLMEENRKSEDG